MKKTAPITFVLILMACQAWAQPEIQIGLPLSGQVQSNNGYILQFGIMEEATSVSPAPTTTGTSTTTTITTTTILPTVSTISSTSSTTGISSTTTTTLPPEPTPEIKIWFDNRLYQKALVEKGEDFIVSKQPKIKVEITIPAPYALDSRLSGYSIALDKTTAASATQRAAGTNASTLDYSIPEALTPGTHTITITAKSAGTKGTPTVVSQSVTVTVKAGALSLIGEPLHFPSPFSPTKNRDGMTIQYTLSENADIDVYVFSVAGETVKRITCFAGTEGGMAGINRVKWDGILDGGGMIGNGIYATTIISKREGRLLGKLKINVFD